MLLNDLIGKRAPVRSDWKLLADKWGIRSDYDMRTIAPSGVLCTSCWDHNLCVECIGEYPDMCPRHCGDGTCGCKNKRSDEMDENKLDGFSISLHNAINGKLRPTQNDALVREHLVQHTAGMLLCEVVDWFHERRIPKENPLHVPLLNGLIKMLEKATDFDGFSLCQDAVSLPLEILEIVPPDTGFVFCLDKASSIWRDEINRIVAKWVDVNGISIDLKIGMSVLVNHGYSRIGTVNVIDKKLARYQVGGHGRVLWIDYDGVSSFNVTTKPKLEDKHDVGFIAECPFCHGNISHVVMKKLNTTAQYGDEKTISVLVDCTICRNKSRFIVVIQEPGVISSALSFTIGISIEYLAKNGFWEDAMNIIHDDNSCLVGGSLQLTQPQLDYIGYDYK